MQHFFASVEKAKSVLGLEPEYGLVEGLTDSYNLDFGRGTFRKEADFSTDDIILGKSLVSVWWLLQITLLILCMYFTYYIIHVDI